ncbi:MAG: YmdB family metallophosphoesterase [Ruminococcus sp.]|nr:YmdB family metallophosphoesterase [Ruminococcus sp.]
MIRILFIGDIVGSHGRKFAAKTVYKLRGKEKIDVVIANGENSADGNGITKEAMEELFSFADVITTGNHCFRRRDFMGVWEESPQTLLRPGNYPEGVPGHGRCILDKGSYSLCVVNIMGTSFMEPIGNPFEYTEKLLPCISTPNIFIDFHAEATGEKKAMGFFLDGKVTAVIGTHTHVQTADETILPGGTAYITDAGMCGAELSVLGVKKELAVQKQRYKMPVRFTESEEPPFFCGVIVTADERTGKALEIRRLQER